MSFILRKGQIVRVQSSFASPDPSGLLYIVATPIGNLGDISARAIETLNNATIIACEDTRTSGNLLRRYGIDTPTIAYHEHNAAAMRPKLLAKLAAGETIALISDAGTPLISDPGHKLVREAREAGFPVSPIPGASAAIAALSVSGIPCEPFTFLGFLPSKAGAKKQVLEQWAGAPTSLAIYESPNRVETTLALAAEILGGGREVAIAREITKQFETIATGTLQELAQDYAAADTVKGEYVLIFGPPPARASLTSDQLEADIRAALNEGRHAKEIAAEFATLTRKSKRDMYQKVIELRDSE